MFNWKIAILGIVFGILFCALGGYLMFIVE